MTNWGELEEMARARAAESGRCLTRPERERIELLQEIESSRRPLRRRLGAALLRLAVRLDPQALTDSAFVHDALREGRLAAYLR